MPLITGQPSKLSCRRTELPATSSPTIEKLTGLLYAPTRSHPDGSPSSDVPLTVRVEDQDDERTFCRRPLLVRRGELHHQRETLPNGPMSLQGLPASVRNGTYVAGFLQEG